ncbi:MAG: N-6 DNA methylase [Oligoflexia bacterium]|nr:N-6 DNA methylase [Oligoflexia bacterium]
MLKSRFHTVQRRNLRAIKEILETRFHAGHGEPERRLVFSLVAAAFASRIGCPDSIPAAAIDQSQDPFTLILEWLKSCDRRFGLALFYCSNFEALRLPAVAVAPLTHDCIALGSKLSIEGLSFLFEKFVHAGLHNKNGVFYTPIRLAAAIARDAIKAARIHRAPEAALRILDPACGAGVFLLEAYKQAIIDAGGTLQTSRAQRVQILTSSIFGVDRDRDSVEMTKLALLLYIFKEEQLAFFGEIDSELPDLSSNIKQGNSLISESQLDLMGEQEEAFEFEPFEWAVHFPQVFAAGGFDVIIGNPPYGLSRDNQIGSAENVRLKQIFVGERSGKLNKYLAFMVKGYRLLNSRGVLSFVVPNSWLGIDGGSAVRKLFLSERTLQCVTLFDSPVFDEPSVEAVTFRVEKGVRADHIEVYRSISLEHGKTELINKIPVEECLKHAGAAIPLAWTNDTSALMEYLNERSIPLAIHPAGFVPMIALQAYAAGKGSPPQSPRASKERIFHTNIREDHSCIPYLEGADIQRYSVHWSGGFLRYGPWLAEPQSLERFSGPRVLIREILHPCPYVMIAAYADKPLLYNKSVLHVLAAGQADADEMLSLCAIFNSKLASFVIKYAGRKSQRRLFPKIVNGDLKDFPLAKAFSSYVPALAQLSRSMLEVAAANSGPDAESAEIQNKIDVLVYEIYALKNSQVETLERVLTNR